MFRLTVATLLASSSLALQRDPSNTMSVIQPGVSAVDAPSTTAKGDLSVMADTFTDDPIIVTEDELNNLGNLTINPPKLRGFNQSHLAHHLKEFLDKKHGVTPPKQEPTPVQDDDDDDDDEEGYGNENDDDEDGEAEQPPPVPPTDAEKNSLLVEKLKAKATEAETETQETKKVADESKEMAVKHDQTVKKLSNNEKSNLSPLEEERKQLLADLKVVDAQILALKEKMHQSSETGAATGTEDEDEDDSETGATGTATEDTEDEDESETGSTGSATGEGEDEDEESATDAVKEMEDEDEDKKEEADDIEPEEESEEEVDADEKADTKKNKPAGEDVDSTESQEVTPDIENSDGDEDAEEEAEKKVE
jgi:hypothetical protein